MRHEVVWRGVTPPSTEGAALTWLPCWGARPTTGGTPKGKDTHDNDKLLEL